jgi:hypothetical protein
VSKLQTSLSRSSLSFGLTLLRACGAQGGQDARAPGKERSQDFNHTSSSPSEKNIRGAKYFSAANGDCSCDASCVASKNQQRSLPGKDEMT